MLLIPSSNLYEKLLNENQGIFFEPILNGNVPFVAKLPSSVIKAIHKDFLIKLFLGFELSLDKSFYHLTICLFIEDDRNHPYITFHTVNNQKELLSIIKAFDDNNKELYMFDELSRNVGSGYLKMKEGYAEVVTRLNAEIINTNIDLENKREVEDRFIMQIENYIKDKSSNNDNIIEVNCEFLSSKPLAISDVNVGEMVLDDYEEGLGFEKTIYQLIESYYLANSFHSPKYYKKGTEKELTDIISFDDTHILLLEAKVLQVMYREKELSTERMMKNIHKNINKAIRQQKGTLKTIRSGKELYSSKGSVLNKPTSTSYEVVHCIVLISEMLPQLNWETLNTEVINFANENEAFLHILDLNELFRTLYISRDTRTFNFNLLRRWKRVHELGTPFIRISYTEKK